MAADFEAVVDATAPHLRGEARAYVIALYRAASELRDQLAKHPTQGFALQQQLNQLINSALAMMPQEAA